MVAGLTAVSGQVLPAGWAGDGEGEVRAAGTKVLSLAQKNVLGYNRCRWLFWQPARPVNTMLVIPMQEHKILAARWLVFDPTPQMMAHYPALIAETATLKLQVPLHPFEGALAP